MNTANDAAEAAEANTKLMQDLWPMLVLLNGLSDQECQWQACTARNDYTDAFGDHIPKGRRHYRKGDSTVYFDPIRLSTTSMQKMLHVLFEWNREGIKLAEDVNAKRHSKLHELLNRVNAPSTDQGA